MELSPASGSPGVCRPRAPSWHIPQALAVARKVGVPVHAHAASQAVLAMLAPRVPTVARRLIGLFAFHVLVGACLRRWLCVSALRAIALRAGGRARAATTRQLIRFAISYSWFAPG